MDNAKAGGDNILAHPMKLYIDNQIDSKLGGNGGGGGNVSSDLERRVANLETDTKAIKSDVHSIAIDIAVVKSNYVTKSDLQHIENKITGIEIKIAEELKKQTMWLVGLLFVAMAGLLTIERMFPPIAETKAIQQEFKHPETNENLKGM